MTRKSTVEEIRARFDADVERFSSLETGQSATMDARPVLDMIALTAAGLVPYAERVLDVGCGAGNYTLRLKRELPTLRDATLMDLSAPMLERAESRARDAGFAEVRTLQKDVREASLPEAGFDLIAAAAVLHHLREEDEWRSVFGSLRRWLRPGGVLLVSDLVSHDDPTTDRVMNVRYGEYLAAFRDEEYRDHVFEYIEREDTPRSVEFQFGLLKEAGFRKTVILHKNAVFAAYYAM